MRILVDRGSGYRVPRAVPVEGGENHAPSCYGDTFSARLDTRAQSVNGSVCETLGEPERHTASCSGRFKVNLCSLDM